MNPAIENISYFIQHSHFPAWFFDALLKSFIVLALAGAMCGLWRRASAATRHLIWLLAVASLPCLPLLTSTLPTWGKPLWSAATRVDANNQVSLALNLAPGAASTAVPAANADHAAAVLVAASNPGGGRQIATHFSANWLVLGFFAWLAGAALVMFSVAAGQFQLRKLSRRAQPPLDADWIQLLAGARARLQLRRNVTLLQSADNVMPLTWGWWRPVVLLPADAENWPEARRRIVLLHELAHVKRWDCLTQLVVRGVCAMYWFNPLVWLAARQMCVERERACDDLVLGAGCVASDYAGHLVDIAGSFRRVSPAAAIAMARPSGLEQRVTAIVDATRTRRLRPATLLAVLAVVGGIIFCVSGCKTIAAGNQVKETDPLRAQQIERLKEFSVLKEKQSELLAAAAGETISSGYQHFFTAATQGDWQTVTNLFESFMQHHPQYEHPTQHTDNRLRTGYWSPVLEICLAYNAVAACEPQYTQLAVDGIVDSIPAGAIYFGGTDPGRGLPTAFCKSQPDADPFYTLTQNALADGTYLEYLQRTYGEQKPLLHQFAAARQADSELRSLDAAWLAAVLKQDAMEVNEADPKYEAARKAVRDLEEQRSGRAKDLMVYVKAHTDAATASREKAALYIPTTEDQQKCFNDYVADATERLHNHQLKPGEDIKDANGHTEVSGQAAVMSINGLLVKLIFDKNPGHEFYVEESFPFDWMYPNLEPHGLIFKLNREPVTEMAEATVQSDRDYWQKIVPGMIGGWLNDDTSVSEVTAFGEKIFLRHDLTGFTGDPRFVQNEYASKMFFKFRSAIAGLYAWRVEHAANDGEKERMARAADFAYRQALALCPSAPEAVYHYAEFLMRQHREADANLVLALPKKFEPRSANLPASPVLQMRLVVDAPSTDTEPMTVVQGGSAAGSRPAETLNIQKTVLLDQTDLKSAKVTKDNLGSPMIEFTLTDAGRMQFARITREHLHQRLAMIIDGKLWSAPNIASEITGGSGQITGSFSAEQAETLAAELNDAAAK
ncbi:MAG: M56 family metallopeptidase [Verrucomicrobiae bacterium]|nr:M56 family metallopeptidase [Verrucomicrobiae bacterium]